MAEEAIEKVGADPERSNTKLVNWKNAPSLKELKNNFNSAHPIQQTAVTKISSWLDNMNVVGKAKVNGGTNRSSVVPRLIRKQAEWRYASLSEPFLSTDDLFNVRPVTWEDRDAARQNELLLSNQFTVKMDRTAFIDEYVRTAVDEGTVILRVGWEFEEEEYTKEEYDVEYVVDPEFGPTIEHVLALKEESPSQYITDVDDEFKYAAELSLELGVPMRPEIMGKYEVTATRTVKNQPTVAVCDYRNVIIDPSCHGNIDKANFVIHSFESSLSELKKTGLYKNLDKIQIKNSTIPGSPDHQSDLSTSNFNFEDDARKRIVVYEYWGFWDIDGSGLVKPIVVSWVNDTIIRMEENPYPDQKLPFVVVQYLPVRRSIYGESDGALLEDNQKIYGAITRGMIDTLAKNATGQMGIRRDMLDTQNKKRFEAGKDYYFNPSVDPRQGVITHTFAELPQSALTMLELQQHEAESLTGVKSYAQGINASSLGDVAASVRGALDAASKRELGILRRLSNGLIQVARKFISMNAVFLEEEEVIRITNEQFTTIHRDDLAGNFDLKLSISTAEEDNAKVERLAFMLQTMGNTLPPDLSKFMLADLFRLQKMPDMAQQIITYKPEPDPMQQKMLELEIQEKEIEIRKKAAEAMEIETQALLNQSKARVEDVRAGHIQSDKDLKDLSFIEQESGVTQARAKELHGAQAEAQTKMKMIDGEIKLRIEDMKLKSKNNEKSTT